MADNTISTAHNTVWITGASSGIGKAVALLCSTKGYALVLSSRKTTQLEEVRQQCLVSQQGTATTVVETMDCANLEETTLITQKLASSIDTVVLCAGVSQRAYAHTLDSVSEQYIYTVNFLSVISTIKQLIIQWSTESVEKRKKIIVISSIAGHIAAPLRAMYGASKRAVEHYCETVQNELWQSGIKHIEISIVIPGFVNTDISKHAILQNMQEWGKLDQNQQNGISAERAAKLICNVISNKKYIPKKYLGLNISLSILRGIYAIFPKLANKILSKVNTAK